jgi:hypothetical protein
MTQSILSRIPQDRIVYDPFPYVHSEEALEPAYYAELAAAFPSMSQLVGERPAGNNRAFWLSAFEVVDNPAIPQVWRDFFAYHCSPNFLADVLTFWGRAIEIEYPQINAMFGKPLSQVRSGLRMPHKQKVAANRKADVMLDVQFGLNTPVIESTSVKGPHIDNPWKLFAGLLYFRLPQDDSTGGDLDLYRLKTDRYHHDARRGFPERFITPVKTIPYRPNTLIMWLNTARSIHGVSPRSVTPHPRCLVNFVSECYNISNGEFFARRRSVMGKVGTAVRRLVGMHDA